MLKSWNFLLFLMILLFVGQPAVLAAELDVPRQYSTIKDAFYHAQLGDQINVAPGHYYERNLVIPEGITLIGAGETPEEVIIDASGLGRILLGESLDTNSTIQRITFINGRATGETPYDQGGGAILLNNCVSKIINCRFINNFAEGNGGAIRCTHSSPQIIDCYFENNTAQDSGGGAIDCSYYSNPGLQSSFFKGNEANWGGAISFRGEVSSLLINCNFESNRAAGNLGYGGAIMADSQAYPSFLKCTFYGNQARYGGAFASFENSRPRLNSCTLVNNSSQFLGAGLVCSKSNPIIEKSIIAFQDGTAVGCVNSAHPQIECSNFFGNQGGDWTNAIADLINVDGNISTDPLFCSPYPDGDFQFNLRDNSPCSDENNSCGLMGAWEASCSITPTFVNSFSAIWDDGVPRITWFIIPAKAGETFILKRIIGADLSDEVIVPIQSHYNGHFISLDSELQPETNQEYHYRLYMILADGTLSLVGETSLAGLVVNNPLHLIGAWPNPFNPRTTISFEISREKRVLAAVHDISGRLVTRLADQIYSAGIHELAWDGRDGRGRRMESGTYFVLLQSEGLTRSHKVLLLK